MPRDLLSQRHPRDLLAAHEEVGVVKDVAKATGSGLVTGAEYLLGMGGDAEGFIQWVGDWVGDKLYGPEEAALRRDDLERRGYNRPTALPSSADIAGLHRPVTGFNPYEAKTTAGKYANTIAEFSPAAVAGGVPGIVRQGVRKGTQRLGVNAFKFAGVPGATSEAAGQATEGTALEPYARMVGALGGYTAIPVARRMLTPNPIRAGSTRQASVDTLKREGVTHITAGQATGRKRLQYSEAELGGARVADMAESSAEQFTSAALQRAGIGPNVATRAMPEVLDGAFDRIGGVFKQFGRNNVLQIDSQLSDDVMRALSEYAEGVPPNMQTPAIAKVGDDMVRGMQANPGAPALSGVQYTTWRSRLGKLAQNKRINDPEAAEAARDLQSALDSAMERSIAATGDMQALEAIKQARRQYRNMLVIEHAAAAGGPAAASGLISPAQLRIATQKVMGKRSYVRGQDDFADLARAGVEIMTPLPQSGTAPRLGARMLNTGPTAIGALAGHTVGDIPGAVAGAVAGSAVPGAAGAAILSRPGRAYLGNQRFSPYAPNRAPTLPPALINTTLPVRRREAP